MLSFILYLLMENLKSEEYNEYYMLEKRIKHILDDSVQNNYNKIYSKLSESEKKNFTYKPFEISLKWILNINFTYPGRGDISTSCLQKVILNNIVLL